MNENQTHNEVARHLKVHHRDVTFFSNHEDGRKRHATEQAQIKRLNSSRARPDLEILEPRAGFHGLMIEIKKDNKQVYKADGVSYKNDHIKEQALMLYTLGCKGYVAVFGEGAAHCKQIIDEYLALPRPNYTPPQYSVTRPPDPPEDDDEPF